MSRLSDTPPIIGGPQNVGVIIVTKAADVHLPVSTN